MLRKLLAIIAVCIVVSGCADADKLITKKDMQLEQIKTNELKQKIEEKESFLLMVSQTSCSECDLMKRTLLPFSRIHEDIDLVELKLDEQGDKISDTDQAFQDVKTLIPAFSGGVPQFFYFKEGKMKKEEQGAMSEAAWQNFMIECGLLHGEKLEEETPSYTVTVGNYMKEISITKLGKLLKKKESFYLYYAREDRYNASFSKKLKAYTDTEQTEVFVLNSSQITQPEGDKERKAMDEGMRIINQTMNLSLSPSLYQIKGGKVKAELKDNVSKEEITKWFSKFPLKK